MENVEVITARPEQTPAMAALLTDAFLDDPVWLTIFKNEAARRRCLPCFFAHMLRVGFLWGEIHTVGPSPRGLALWLPPGRGLISFGMDVRAGGLKLLFRVPAGALFHAMAMQDEINRRHRELMHGPHYTLSLLAVAPAFQGQGLASALIRPMLLRAEQETTPVYLETQREGNVALYEHFGFRVIDRIPLRGGGRSFTYFLLRGRSD